MLAWSGEAGDERGGGDVEMRWGWDRPFGYA